MRNTQRDGFTLVELLVVIAIITILAGLLLPALVHAKEMARMVACMSNLKQMTTFALSYGDDFNEFPWYYYEGAPTEAQRDGNIDRNKFAGISMWQQMLGDMEDLEYITEEVGYCSKAGMWDGTLMPSVDWDWGQNSANPNDCSGWWVGSQYDKLAAAQPNIGDYVYRGYGTNCKLWNDERFGRGLASDFPKLNESMGVHFKGMRSMRMENPAAVKCKEGDIRMSWSGRTQPLFSDTTWRDYSAPWSQNTAGPHFLEFKYGGKINTGMTDGSVQTFLR